MSGPLEGIRVLDWTHAMAGPFCGLILADLGADVIKIEGATPETRPSRRDHPFVNGESLAFMMVNRNKRSFTVNLKDPRGRDIFHRLVATADILVQNFRPGVTRRLGADYAALRSINPRLVYVSISGFGQGSPYEERAGLDLITQGMSGLMSCTGEPDGPPAKAGVAVCDMGTGMYGVIGALAALQRRAVSGEGQHVDVSLLDTPISWLPWEAALYWGTGQVPGRLGSGHRLGVPYQAFACADGVSITVGASSTKHFTKLCALLGAPELASDPRFDAGEKRLNRRAELTAELEPLFARQTSAELLDALLDAGIPSGPINSVDFVLDREPHVRAKEMVVEVEHPTAGRVRHLGVPVKLSATPGGVWRPAPLPGQHTREILAQLGYGASEIEALGAAEVI